ncbi:MAG TPA: hypothetical protein VM680_14490 [Verrucomicrobiae bacterium]|nr:hypothetical protein [Verrucomicrobiae bacterium]
MKTLLLFLLLALDARAQGLVLFYNRNLEDPDTHQLYNASVTLPNGAGVEGSAFTAGLFLSQTGSFNLIATTFFREGAGAGLFTTPQGSTEVPGIPPGLPATFRARVWETAAGSYENAIASGRFYGEFVTKIGSPDIFIPELGMPNPPGSITVPTLAGIQPLVLIPEPQALALATFAGGFLLLAQKLFRRKR